MFVVLVMGATVTNTGSAEGCGRSWPLCNGQFIPEFAVATLIENMTARLLGEEDEIASPVREADTTSRHQRGGPAVAGGNVNARRAAGSNAR